MDEMGYLVPVSCFGSCLYVFWYLFSNIGVPSKKF